MLPSSGLTTTGLLVGLAAVVAAIYVAVIKPWIMRVAIPAGIAWCLFPSAPKPPPPPSPETHDIPPPGTRIKVESLDKDASGWPLWSEFATVVIAAGESCNDTGFVLPFSALMRLDNGEEVLRTFGQLRWYVWGVGKPPPGTLIYTKSLEEDADGSPLWGDWATVVRCDGRKALMRRDNGDEVWRTFKQLSWYDKSDWRNEYRDDEGQLPPDF